MQFTGSYLSINIDPQWGGAKAHLDLPIVINYNIIDITLAWL